MDDACCFFASFQFDSKVQLQLHSVVDPDAGRAAISRVTRMFSSGTANHLWRFLLQQHI